MIPRMLRYYWPVAPISAVGTAVTQGAGFSPVGAMICVMLVAAVWSIAVLIFRPEWAKDVV